MRAHLEFDGLDDGRGTHLDDSWQNDGECRQYVGVVNFFPTRGESAADAKAVCAACPVRQDCLEFALHEHIAYGVWGGLSERERRRVRRARAKAPGRLR